MPQDPPPSRTIVLDPGPHSFAELTSSADEFMRRYGYCLSAWARLEVELGNWFHAICGIPSLDTAMTIFFSTNSYAAREKMLRDINNRLPASGRKSFIASALKKAKNYNEFRNSLAHELVIHDADANEVYFKRPGKPERRKIKMDELVTMGENFRALRLILARGIALPPRPAAPLAALRREIEALPTFQMKDP